MKTLKKLISTDLLFFVASPALLWQILFLWIPLIFILYLGFSKPDFTGFTLSYFKLVIDEIHIRIIIRSLITALITSFVCLTIAYPMAYFLAFKVKRFKNFFLFFLTLPLWVNFLVQIYSWFFVLEHYGVINKFLLYLGLISNPIQMINNSFAIMLVMVHVYLPFLIMPLYNALEKFDLQLIEASLDLGASYWKTFLKVTLPLSFSGAYLGFFLVFVMSFGELAIPVLIGGNKKLYVGSLISEYFLGARNIHNGAAFTVLSGIFLGLTLLLFFIIFRKTIWKGK